ncbi:hypothetical protein O181_007289 [Austropuccinia psidii MF-1]|uniref:Uncharacterized protein n=1 Tax=Austropuccinia psidii MF-1 TaxID=1389203 RepID=A0A9Q3GHR0_9BASI|nr:hypothetical protein [Austropuccinia psidii MF-1]
MANQLTIGVTRGGIRGGGFINRNFQFKSPTLLDADPQSLGIVRKAIAGLRTISFCKIAELTPAGPSSSRFNTRNPFPWKIGARWLNNSDRLETIVISSYVINLCRGILYSERSLKLSKTPGP